MLSQLLVIYYRPLSAPTFHTVPRLSPVSLLLSVFKVRDDTISDSQLLFPLFPYPLASCSRLFLFPGGEGGVTNVTDLNRGWCFCECTVRCRVQSAVKCSEGVAEYFGYVLWLQANYHTISKIDLMQVPTVAWGLLRALTVKRRDVKNCVMNFHLKKHINQKSVIL